jgi:alpha-glucosidase (family GH31 glycosyl hydrolase)
MQNSSRKFFINLFYSSLILFCCISNKVAAQTTLQLTIETGEFWWGGVIDEGKNMPFTKSSVYSIDMFGSNHNNQEQPLLLSNRGRYIWSEEPFKFEIKDNLLTVNGTGKLDNGKAGNSLKEVQQFVTKKYFAASGKLPDTLLLSRPQYNTWIELTYNQNQADVLKYAHGIVDNGLPTGVLMIDDTWQEDYGVWDFHPKKFPDPKAMVNELHKLGFKVMLWICPFVSADQQVYRKLRDKKAFLLNPLPGNNASWEQSKALPLLVQWWNGASAELDFTNPVAVDWFNEKLNYLTTTYGIDGFKFDAGDMAFYPVTALTKEMVTPNKHCELFGQFGLKYPLNEYRAMWKNAGQPLVQRLCDKAHSWEDAQKLIPNMLLSGMVGYSFSCPDLIGGGEWTSFIEGSGDLQTDLIVRSAQIHALMPMMQFSVAPWRILNKEELAIVKNAVAIRTKFTPLIMALAKKAAQTGEPIVRSMEYQFPDNGYAQIKDQFMLGSNLLVAPATEKGQITKKVYLPKGKWKSDDGKIYKGGQIITINVPLERLPYFELVQ